MRCFYGILIVGIFMSLADSKSIGIKLLTIIFGFFLILLILCLQIINGGFKETKNDDYKIVLSIKKMMQIIKKVPVQIIELSEFYKCKKIEYIRKEILPLRPDFLVIFKEYADNEMSKFKLSNYLKAGVLVAFFIPIWSKFVDFLYLVFINEIDLSSLNYSVLEIVVNIVVTISLLLFMLWILLMIFKIEFVASKKEEFLELVECIEKAIKSE